MILLKKFNGFLWIFLGIMIFVWILIDDPIIELMLWIGFGLGCILVGVIQFADLEIIDQKIEDMDEI